MRKVRLTRSADAAALKRNAGKLKTAAGGRKLIAVVKGNAYGNGLVRCAKALEGEAAMFAVATAEESRALAKAKICVPVLILGALTAGEIREAVRCGNAAITVSSLSEAAYADRLAREFNRRVAVHIAVDSGMHRFGFAPDPRTMGLVATFPNLTVEGIYTHYCRANDGEFTKRQSRTFCRVVDALCERGMRFDYVHAAASAAVCRGEGLCGNSVRVGIALYGEGALAGIEQVARVVAHILCVRTLERGDGLGYGDSFCAPCRMRVAAVSAGYADGVPFSLSNRGVVLVKGTRCPVVGAVCMDVFFCDVSAAGDVREGDPAIVVGRDGAASIGMAEQAAFAGTTAYELSVRLGALQR